MGKESKVADVKKLSQKKVVTIEECALQFDKRDLAEMIEAENPETTVVYSDTLLRDIREVIGKR